MIRVVGKYEFIDALHCTAKLDFLCVPHVNGCSLV
jgi:hypothetical protein